MRGLLIVFDGGDQKSDIVCDDIASRDCSAVAIWSGCGLKREEKIKNKEVELRKLK